MNVETTIARMVELTKRAEDAIEFALKLKGGLLVERSPAFQAGKKVPIGERHVAIYRPRGRELTPGMIHGDEANPKTDPHLAYAITGRRKNYVKAIKTPAAGTKDDVMKNVSDGLAIRKVFTGHLDHRRIISRTHASAFAHEAIPTAGLVGHYKRAGYEIDTPTKLAEFRKARLAGGPEFAQELLQNRVPMIRRPKPSP